MTDLRYPIGRFQRPEVVTESDLHDAVEAIATLPAQMRAAVSGWSAEQLDTPYRRPDGWTVRQLLHHVPESHMNSYIRFKLALTEEEPTIKPYDEDAWARLPDAKAPVDVSLDLLDTLHQRWVFLLRSMTAEQWSRTFRHPEIGVVRLDVNAMLYSWHGKHHLAHITGLRDRKRW